MNDLQMFKKGAVKLPVKEVNGQILFDAEQSAIGLGISLEKNGTVYVRWERVRKYLNSPQVEKGDFITEPQFYKLAIKANNSVAEKFQDWVTSEVLPAIRKHGAYMTDKKADEVINRQGLAQLLQQAADQLNTKDKQIERLQPKAEKYDRYLSSKGLITITEVAKEYGMSGRELNEFLHKKGVIYKKGDKWFVYKKYANDALTGYEIYIPREDKELRRTLKWTTKGVQFIRGLLDVEGIKPVLERPQQLEMQEQQPEYDGEWYTASSIVYYLGLSEEYIVEVGKIANKLHLKPMFTDCNQYCRKTLDDNGFPRWEYTRLGAGAIEKELYKLMR